MKTFTVDFRTDAEYAIEEIKAWSGKDALRKARAVAETSAGELTFTPYDDGHPVNEILIRDADGNEVAVWYDAELRLRLAASDLLDALEAQTERAQAVIDNWERGDLAAAVRALGVSINAARDALAKAKGGHQ
jgi:hypothetical protein